MENKPNTRKFITIPLWVNEYLGLNGNELILFSYIYGFSQDDCSYCYSGITEITNTMHISRRNVFNLINSLLEKGLIIKEETKVYGKTMIGYRYNKEAVDVKQREYYENCTGGEKNSLEEVKKLHLNSEIIAPNNKYDNKYINNNINSEINLSSSNSKKSDNKEKENIYETIVSPIFSQDSKKKHSKRFEKPTFEEVEAYIREQSYDIDPHTFFDYYEACGWTVGKNKPMKDWKASVRYWVSSRKNNGYASKPAEEEHQFNVRQYFPGDEDKIPF